MPELDAFETRFAAAYRRYLDEMPTAVDAAEVARAVALQARARRLALPWTVRPVPALAWLVLVGLVVTSLIAAALFVGSQRHAPVAFACRAGSNPDEPGPDDQARPAMPDTAAFDRRAGKLVALADAGNGIETWTFDVCTNTWTQMHPDQAPPMVDWPPAVYDVDSAVTILISAGKAWAYDLEADTWTEKGAAPTGTTPWAYDPLSGLVVAGNYDTPEQLWDYDVETDTWTPVRQTNLPDGVDPPYVAYDASVDRFIGYGGETWLLDIRTGTWTRSGVAAPNVLAGYGWQAPEIAYDESAERTVVFGNAGMALYDASTDSWEVLDAAADWPDLLPISMVYDPVNERLVGCVWLHQISTTVTGVFAFDLVTREWTVLFEAP